MKRRTVPGLAGPTTAPAGIAGGSSLPVSTALVEYLRIKREYASVPKGSHGIVKIAASDDGTIAGERRRAFPQRVDVRLDSAEGHFMRISETRPDLSQQQKKK